MNKNYWLSFHLFYSEDPSIRFFDDLSGIIKNLKSKKIIRLFFFIRYSEGGAHFRFRFFVRKNVNDSSILNLLLDLKEKHEEILKIISSNYSPEKERYGGHYSMKMIEKQFEISSLNTIVLFASHDYLQYSRKFEIALITTFLIVHSFTKDLNLQFHVLKYYSNDWKQYKNKKFQIELESIENSYRDSFSKNETKILQFLLKTQTNNSDDFFIENKKIMAVLRKIHKFSNSEYSEKVLKIVTSIIHMNNNRIGIKNLDEGLIGYLLMKGIFRLNEIFSEK